MNTKPVGRGLGHQPSELCSRARAIGSRKVEAIAGGSCGTFSIQHYSFLQVWKESKLGTDGVFDEEVLIDCLSKDVPQVSSDLEHSILGVSFRQIVEVDLQGELVEIPQRSLVERIDQIPLDEEFLHLSCFFLPLRLFEREKAVPNGAGIRSRLSGLLGDFAFQCLSGFSRLHLGLGPENN